MSEFEDEMIARVASALAEMRGILAPVQEAVEGWRVQMEQAGYPDGLARQMAVEYHGYLMRVMSRG